MADKSADIHTLAPRLSYVEDLANWLKDNRGSGSGTLDTKLWRVTVEGAEPGALSDQPWTQTDLIYGPDSANALSMHQTVFGLTVDSALKCQDGSGFYGHVFYSNDVRWTTTVTSNARPLVEDVFAAGSTDFVAAFRSKFTSLCKAIWDLDVNSIGTSRATSIIGRLEKLEQDVQDLRDDLNGLETYVDAQIARLDQRISDIS